jgi:hypothetical protein
VESKEIKTNSLTVRLIAPQIVENIIHDYVTVEKEDILTLKKLNGDLTAGKPYAVLVNSGLMTSISKDARELSASMEFVQNTRAKAILVKSIGHQLVANVYIKINKPHIKTVLFNDRNKAIKWLEEQVALSYP